MTTKSGILKIRLTSQPLWLVGFRPFFVLAMLAGMSFPVLWVLIYSGIISAPNHSFSLVQWHAHEMFFGFGWAVLAGFMLTATKNWVKIRGYHGSVLIFLAASWLFERVGMWQENVWPLPLFIVSNNLFVGSIVAMLVWTLIKHRKTDTYRDNYFFLLILPVFILSKNLMLSADSYQIGEYMAVGLFRVAFLVMLERTLAEFMKNAFQVAILRNVALNTVIKLLALVLVFTPLSPVLQTGIFEMLLSILLTARLIYWKPQLGMRRLDTGVMYLGYLAIIGQLLIECLRLTGHLNWSASQSIHVFTFGAMGLIIPAMQVRISKGHTGRKVIFEKLDKLALVFMLIGFVFRVIAPRITSISYTLWISLAALCWFVCFLILAWRYIPILMKPRIDGREY